MWSYEKRMLTSVSHPVNEQCKRLSLISLVVVNHRTRVIPSARTKNAAMSSDKNLVVIESATAESACLTRRAMVQRLLAGMSAGTAWPLAASSHPVFELLKSDALLLNEAVFARAEELGQANWKPAFLTEEQNEILTALAESIVPDSTRAHVSRFIDLLLSADKPANQHKFAESLATLDAEAQKRFKKSFPALGEEQKNALLTDASTKPKNPDALGAEADKKRSALYGPFENLKGWISGAYYSSEVGMRELGWTGDYAFTTFPGCAHPEGHH